ncbi:MAG: hypothetical protein N7Q72_02420, partial [Spiroplasma sp. Tabriz.8]|nr:hypothetical protein [Spiroplasma sp. Tabriz.8]
RKKTSFTILVNYCFDCDTIFIISELLLILLDILNKFYNGFYLFIYLFIYLLLLNKLHKILPVNFITTKHLNNIKWT